MSRRSKQHFKVSHINGGAISDTAISQSEQTSHSAIDRLWLYRAVFRNKKAGILMYALVASFLLQPFDVSADDTAVSPADVIADEVFEQLADRNVTEETTDKQDKVDTHEEDLIVEAAETETSNSSIDTFENEIKSHKSPTDLEGGSATDVARGTSTSELTLASTSTTEDTEVEPEDILNLAEASAVDLVASNAEVSTTSTTTDTATIATSSTTTSGVSSDEFVLVNEEQSVSESFSSADPNDGGSAPSQSISTSDTYVKTASTSTSTETEEPDDKDEEIFDAGEYDPLIVSVVESDSAYTFGRDECTRVENGAFYCQERSFREVPDNSLAALPDIDGDLEIYLTRDGEQFQITSNNYDDSAPYYDADSETIVWQRLIEDRYQIISYDVETGEETKLTNTRDNNMEPSRHGDFTVWQRWLDGSWEIILHDGRRELRVTESKEHDIAPSLRGSLVIWNAQYADGTQQLQTFDFKTNVRDVIDDDEGVSVGNPRMVVMYEAMYDNGDIVTKGYDLLSGEIVPLHTLPRQLPTELPKADETGGETVALIQNKPTPKESSVELTIASGGPEPDDLTLDLRSQDATLNEEALVPKDNEMTLVVASTTEQTGPDPELGTSSATSTQTE